MKDNVFVSDLYRNKKNVLSFETFPPKSAEGITHLIHHLKELEKYGPDFISVTYGAGGSTHDTSLQALEQISQNLDATLVAHFTCVGATETTIQDFVRRLEALKIKNILALRGDLPQNYPGFDFSKAIFHHANELVAYLKKTTSLCITVAGYPEGHVEALSREKDWDYLKAKVDTGAELIITQLFFDNEDFFQFRDGMQKRGVQVPLVPGILPVSSLERLQKIVNLSGSKISKGFQAILDRYSQDPEGFRKASIHYSQNQIKELLQNGVPGIHYYTLNRSDIVSEVLDGL
jgi:methylenetetrahydrofolate reductase (NADPH)